MQLNVAIEKLNQLSSVSFVSDYLSSTSFRLGFIKRDRYIGIACLNNCGSKKGFYHSKELEIFSQENRKSYKITD